MHAEICPICQGAGTITEAYDPYTTRAMNPQKRCHGCEGTGWVPVRGKPDSQCNIWEAE